MSSFLHIKEFVAYTKNTKQPQIGYIEVLKFKKERNNPPFFDIPAYATSSAPTLHCSPGK